MSKAMESSLRVTACGILTACIITPLALHAAPNVWPATGLPRAEAASGTVRGTQGAREVEAVKAAGYAETGVSVDGEQAETAISLERAITEDVPDVLVEPSGVVTGSASQALVPDAPDEHSAAATGL